MMAHVDLCSGIGGFALGFEWAGLSKPVLFCDIEPWSRKVLAKHWPNVPIAEDVKELANDPDRFIPRTDPRTPILTAGYPCQPFSVAGKQRGTEDDRHIWPFISQIITHKRPAWCVLENVHGHVALGLDEVLADLEAQDYAARAFIVPACAVNAPHRRDRIWIIAHTNSQGEPDVTRFTEEGQRMVGGAPPHDGTQSPQPNQKKKSLFLKNKPKLIFRSEFTKQSKDVPNTSSDKPKKHGHARCSAKYQSWWAVEPRMGDLVDGLPKGLDRFDGWEREPADIPRVATGVKDRVSRLRGLGNAILPQIAMQIGLTIKAVCDE